MNSVEQKRVWYLPLNVVGHLRKPDKKRLVWERLVWHSQRFLFRFDPNDKSQTYIMDVATFGASCFPCSAYYVTHRNAEGHANIYTEASATIKQKTKICSNFHSVSNSSKFVLYLKTHKNRQLLLGSKRALRQKVVGCQRFCI